MASVVDSGTGAIHMVPGQVCLVVKLSGAVAAAEREARVEAVYNALAAQVSAAARRLSRGPKSQDPLARDLAPADPAAFAAYFDLDGAGDIVRARSASDGGQPWAIVPAANGDQLVLKYDVGPATLNPASSAAWTDVAALRERTQPVHQDRLRELVTWLNAGLRDASPADLGGARLLAVSPNWLLSALHSGDSPATPPERLIPTDLDPSFVAGRFRYRFSRANDASASTAARVALDGTVNERRAASFAPSQGVVVAVLDTAPPATRVTAMAAQAPGNLLLSELGAALGDGSFSIEDAGAANALQPLTGIVTALQHVRGQAIALDDHGLFVAGIIRDIAPHARIRLIRVLNEYGVGDLFTLVQTLADLPASTPAGHRLVVNLSLSVDLGTHAQWLATWFAQTLAANAVASSWSQIAQVLDLVQSGMRLVVDYLTDQGVVVVAAAGNRASGPNDRPEPTIPATFDTVLSVAAVNGEDLPAYYANKGDQPIMGNGVAVLGGEGKPNGPGGSLVIPTPSGGAWPDAVAGLFTAATVPLAPAGADANTSGWVWWSGSSFAAPVAAGLAADLMLGASPPAPTVAGVVMAITSFATIPESDLELAGAFDCAAIVARQEWQ